MKKLSNKFFQALYQSKIVTFDFLFAVQHYGINNKILLLCLDILELFTLVPFYINPLLSSLSRNKDLSIYFSNIHPKLHFAYTPSPSSPLICVYVLSVVTLVIFFLRNRAKSRLAQIAAILMAMLPLAVPRLGAQMVNFFTNQYSLWEIIVTILCLGPLAIGFLAGLWVYNKWIKILDFIAAILLAVKIQQYAWMSILLVKIILNIFLGPNIFAKYVKIEVQMSLLVSVFLLYFIEPVLPNYIVLLTFITLCLLYPGFLLYVDSRSMLQNSDKDFDIETNQNYTLQDLQLLSRIQDHIQKCPSSDCICSQVMSIKNPSQLEKWLTQFQKQSLRITFQNGQETKSSTSTDFNKKIQYIEACLNGEKIDWRGFVQIYCIQPQNIYEEYLVYSCKKRYSTLLQKQNPQALNMRVVNQGQASSAYKDLLYFQDLICKIVQKVKLFWNQLLNFQGSNNFIDLILQISEDILIVNQAYLTIDQNYDEKQEAEFYYSIFKLLVLHQRANMSIIDEHATKYLLVTKQQKIINLSTNLTHLVQRNKEQLLGYNYNILMPEPYINDHSQWQWQYLCNYQPNHVDPFTKILKVSQDSMKVVNMLHILIPDYCPAKENGSENRKQSQEGINVVTVVERKRGGGQGGEGEGGEGGGVGFFLLVDRRSLDVVMYEDVFFRCFQVQQTVNNCDKVRRANLKDIFPNLNKDAIFRKDQQKKKLVAKFNEKFFLQNEDFQNQSIKKIFFDEKDHFSHQKGKITVQQVQSSKNWELDLLLLAFEAEIIQKGDSETNTKENRSSTNINIRNKTFKDIVEYSSKQNQMQEKSEKSFTRIKIIMFIVFFMFIGCALAICIYFIAHKKTIEEFLEEYRKRFQLYTDITYTQSYFLNFKLGQSRMEKLQAYWNYNSEFYEMYTLFSNIDSPIFFQKFMEISKNMYITPIFSQSVLEKQNMIKTLNQINFCIYALFYSCIFLIVLNVTVSLVILMKSEAKSIQIISSFLNFDAKAIKSNLDKMENLENLLQLQEFSINKSRQDKHLKSLATQNVTSLVDLHYFPQSQPLQRLNLNEIFNNYLEQFISKKQLQPESPKKQNFEQSANPLKTHIEEIKIIPSELTLYKLSKKNSNIILITITQILLNLCICLLTLLMFTKYVNQISLCLDAKTQYFKQNILFLNKIQSEYFQIYNGFTYNISFYNYESDKMVQDLPQDFQELKQFAKELKDTDDLCGLLKENQGVFGECWGEGGRFRFGVGALVQTVQEKIRRVRSLEWDRRVFLRDGGEIGEVDGNDILEFQVFLAVLEKRNQLFSIGFEKFMEKNNTILTIVNLILFSLFFICFCLKIKETRLVSDKTKKAQNLFKIVPSFMKKKEKNL